MIRTRHRARRHVAVLVALGLAACGGGDDARVEQPGDTVDPGASEVIGDEGDPVDGGVLVMGIPHETSGWNPAIDRWAPTGALVGSSMLEPLATLDADAVAQPWLATGWEASDDYTTWTVTLRDGVTFHNGEAFDAEAVKANLDFVRTALLSSVAYGEILGEVVVVDDLTVEINLNERWAAFPESFLAGQPAFQRAPAALAAADVGREQPIGTGPFVFDEWERDVQLTVTRNDSYWRDGEPHLDGIEFRVITDTSSRAAALRANDIALTIVDDATIANEAEADFTVLRNWGVEPTLVFVNTRATVGGEPNPLGNLHARRAVAHAIDRDALAAAVGDGVLTPTSPFDESSPWGQPEDENGYPPYDPELAREELALYTADTGEETLRFQLLGPTEPGRFEIQQLLVEQLAAVGIEVDVQKLETNTRINEVLAGSYQAAEFLPYSAPDPDQNYYYWDDATIGDEGGLSINMTAFSNDVTEEMLDIGRQAATREERKEAYSTLIRELNEHAVHWWMYGTPISMLAADDVRGLRAVSEVPFANFHPKTWWGGIWMV